MDAQESLKGRPLFYTNESLCLNFSAESHAFPKLKVGSELSGAHFWLAQAMTPFHFSAVTMTRSTTWTWVKAQTQAKTRRS